MAYGACDPCGCALEECECADRCPPAPRAPGTCQGAYLAEADEVDEGLAELFGRLDAALGL